VYLETLIIGFDRDCAKSTFFDIWRFLVNRINPRKLLSSKWTAVNPTNKEKHFLVSEIEFDEEGAVIACLIEAVMSNRQISIEWQELQDRSHWLHGWR
jgi:tryptophan-rich hypothetical protein